MQFELDIWSNIWCVGISSLGLIFCYVYLSGINFSLLSIQIFEDLLCFLFLVDHIQSFILLISFLE